MKKIQATVTSWVISLIAVTLFAAKCMSAAPFGVTGFIITMLTLVAFVLAIWESITWESQCGKYINGPYFFLLRKPKESDRQSWSDYDKEISMIDELPDKNGKFKKPKGKRYLIIGIVLAIFGYIFSQSFAYIDAGAKIYNKSKLYQNAYQQKVDEKKGFYDKLWKTYLTKEKITNVNKETFLVVTKTIMENRKDGPNITWKWAHENQNIPYEEFTKFYADLSSFITSQREGYFNIEKECMSIANANNTLLDTFPNNIYNKILECPHIKFEYGMLSDSTENVFRTKKENLK